jgi:hypothetical protein
VRTLPNDTPSSEASVLLRSTRKRGRASLAFYARRILGFRSLREARLVEIQNGKDPGSSNERFALRKWNEFRSSTESWIPKGSRALEEQEVA